MRQGEGGRQDGAAEQVKGSEKDRTNWNAVLAESAKESKVHTYNPAKQLRSNTADIMKK